METPCGLRGTIIPSDPWRGVKQAYTFEKFQISLDDGVLEIGYDDESVIDEAREVVQKYLKAFNLENGTRYRVDLNHSWRPSAGGRLLRASLSDHVNITDSISVGLNQVTLTGRACIVNSLFETNNFDNHTSLVRRAEKDSALSSALTYFNDEVIEAERPLYGIYKAVEAMTQALTPVGQNISKGREALAKLAGHHKKYVDDVMKTAGPTRHHRPSGSRVLTDDECEDRARVLIRAYANSVPI